MLATGSEKLERMRDGRVVYIGAERVDDVTSHPAFRNGARTIAALYDLKADPARRDLFTFEDNGERIGLQWLRCRSREDLARRMRAMKAIAENNIHPWPDGATFAKGAWAQQVDANGDTKTGAFIQVEFMIKDSSKYAATKGWGFARWRGDDLKPYGKDEHFASECVGCHNPLRDNDYVYTLPLIGQQSGQQQGQQ